MRDQVYKVGEREAGGIDKKPQAISFCVLLNADFQLLTYDFLNYNQGLPMSLTNKQQLNYPVLKTISR
ncbi:MAG: hypothetical protein JWQ09_894 [Segetibacter sp.]|nr:hypothetical protein [Segetibacter sp.]